MRPTRVKPSRQLRLEQLELRLTPATFEVQGATLLVNGTPGNDQFLFIAGPDQHTARMNGEWFLIDSRLITSVVVDGKGGSDLATEVGNTSANRVVMNPGSGTLTGDTYYVSVAGFAEIHFFGGANDYALLYDSAGNDTFQGGRIGLSVMYGPGYLNAVHGVGQADGVSRQGSDYALFRDSTGNDTFTSFPGYATLSGLSGQSYLITASAFPLVHADATAGGTDTAYFHGTAGDDGLQAFPTFVNLYQGSNYIGSASGFESSTAILTQGGNDRAAFYGSSGNDSLSTGPYGTTLTGPGYANSAVGAKDVTVDATQAGADAFSFSDQGVASTLANTSGVGFLETYTLKSNPFYASTMYNIVATGFPGSVTAYLDPALSGADLAPLLYGPFTLTARQGEATLVAAGRTFTVYGSQYSTIIPLRPSPTSPATFTFYDSPGNDEYTAAFTNPSRFTWGSGTTTASVLAIRPLSSDVVNLFGLSGGSNTIFYVGETIPYTINSVGF